MLVDARRAQRERFDLQAFHDALCTNGNVQLTLQRWEMLGLRDDVDIVERRARETDQAMRRRTQPGAAAEQSQASSLCDGDAARVGGAPAGGRIRLTEE